MTRRPKGEGVIDALLLDFDGLVLDTEPTEFAALSSVLAANGAALEYTDWHITVGRESPDWLTRVAAPGSARYIQLGEELRERQEELLADEPLRPGIRTLFDEAARAAVPVVVVTSGTRARVEAQLARHGLLSLLRGLVCREDVTETKPSPEPYLAGLRLADARAAQTLAFEDTEYGVVAATAAGIRCVAVPTTTTQGQDFSLASIVLDRLDAVDLRRMIRDGQLATTW